MSLKSSTLKDRKTEMASYGQLSLSELTQPRGIGGTDEELASVGIRACVGHRQSSFSYVRQVKVLV